MFPYMDAVFFMPTALLQRKEGQEFSWTQGVQQKIQRKNAEKKSSRKTTARRKM
jgi:hypothetical protein